jgi:hypothetical protein
LLEKCLPKFSYYYRITPYRLIKSGCAFFGEDLFDPADDTACEAHFNPVGMGGGPGENILNDSLGQFASALILLLDNLDPGACLNIGSVSSTHFCLPLFNKGLKFKNITKGARFKVQGTRSKTSKIASRLWA